MAEERKALREIDTPFYNYLQALYLSFFSRRLYVDVGKRWKEFGIRYLLLLTCLLTIPFALRIAIDFNRFFAEQIIQPLESLPPLYIQNGKVSLDKPMPYLIKNKSGQVVSIVDTTGTVKAIDNTYPYLATLITQDTFYYRIPSPQFFFAQGMGQSESPVYSQKLSEDINQVFDGQTWINSSGVKTAKYLSLIIMYPTIALLFFGMFLVLFLVLALMGQFLAKLFFKLSISYKQSSRLLIVSSTPSLIVLLAGLALNWFFSGFGLLVLILLAGYFSFAVLSLRRESHKLVIS